MLEIKVGSILKGPFFNEKVRVISSKLINNSQIKIEAVGLDTQRFYNPIFSSEDLLKINIVEESPFKFSGNGEQLFLYLEANRIKNAYQFDPLFAVNISQIDPLPHQIDAVYERILKNPRIRYLLADDPGAGKTIMAGLLIKELKYRGLIERILIVCPGHLKDQWKRELKEKFQEIFHTIDRSVINNEWGRNVFNEKNQAIISIDFAKQDDVSSALESSSWDFCIVDEAHKMSAYKYGDKTDKTQRYSLGELLSRNSMFLLFLTATPHRGDPENFRLLLDLLVPDFFVDTSMLNESIKSGDNPLIIRRLKEDLKDFNGIPLFPPRKVETLKFSLSEEEKILYLAVTKYVEKHFNKALEKDKRNVAFALTILQRRLSSSVRAIRKSLERRHDRLKDLYLKGEQYLKFDINYNEDSLEDLEERERLAKEEELLEKLTSADTLYELQDEIDKLSELILLAKNVEKREIETKLIELKKVMEKIEELKDVEVKFLIFTESKDTMEYLVEKLKNWGYSVTFIHGGMSLDDRIKAENDFNNTPVQVMVSTEAGGEGINLQKRCWIMFNYDIPWNPNRLEQRMGRIHRYGQKHEVHIYNLVSTDTREGQILDTLFKKLDFIRQHLGSDRVFDVIGEILWGKSLKDLIMDAVANRRTLTDIIKDMEITIDEEAIERIKKVSQEALATRHIDLSRILGEKRLGKENKLSPEYIEEFFKKASELLKFTLEKREDGLWRITNVPWELRNQSYDFKINYGEVQREYYKITFDKDKALSNQAEFVSMGHPLMEAVTQAILTNYGQQAREGAVFVDPDGKLNGHIWFLEGLIRDGRDDNNGKLSIAGKKLFAVYQDMNNALSLINPAVIWDLKPLKDGSKENLLKMDSLIEENSLDLISSYVLNEGLNNYKSELLQTRLRNAEIKKKYGIRSLENYILQSDSKIADYEIRKSQGQEIPEVVISNERRKKEDYERKLELLKREIEAESHLYPTEPTLLGVIRVLTDVANLDPETDKEIEQIGMLKAMEFEMMEGRIPEDVSSQFLGYDIKSCDQEGNYRYIEVKALSKEGQITLTPNEWLKAQRWGEEYWLYVVINATSKPELHILQNPALHLKPREEISIVRYIVADWKNQSRRVI